MIVFLKNILVVIFLLGIVIVVTNYSDLIRQSLTKKVISSMGQVEGVSTSSAQSNSFSHKITQEVKNNVNSIQSQTLQIRLLDIVNTFSQAKKFTQDLSSLQVSFKKQLQKLAK